MVYTMKILLTFRDFSELHGTSMYFYDLACGLKKQGVDVSILSVVKGQKPNSISDLANKCEKIGVKCYNFNQAPNIKFDMIIASHRTVISQFIDNKLYSDTPIIQICHATVINEEFPIVNARIVHYIAVRPEIAKMLQDKYYLDESQISTIWNPINFNRILSTKRVPPRKKTVLFPGTIDYLRKETLLSLYEKAKAEDFKLVVVGKKFDTYLDDLDPRIISVHIPTWNMKNYYARATHTASIFVGRTTIEGWLWGLPSLVYTVDEFGKVQGMTEMNPLEDMDHFNHINVAKQVINVIEHFKS